MPKITVYPTVEAALNVKHPLDGKLKRIGSMWENDGFTARLLTDGEITKDIKQALDQE